MVKNRGHVWRVAVLGIGLLCSLMPRAVSVAQSNATSQPIAAEATAADQSQRTQAAGKTTSKPTRMRDDIRVRRWGMTIGWGLFIIIVFFAAAIAIVVFSRRFSRLMRSESKPTQSDDAWAMHVAPEFDEAHWDKPGDASADAPGDQD